MINGKTGVQAARAAGMKAIAVLNTQTRSDLAAADIIVDPCRKSTPRECRNCSTSLKKCRRIEDMTFALTLAGGLAFQAPQKGAVSESPDVLGTRLYNPYALIRFLMSRLNPAAIPLPSANKEDGSGTIGLGPGTNTTNGLALFSDLIHCKAEPVSGLLLDTQCKHATQ